MVCISSSSPISPFNLLRALLLDSFWRRPCFVGLLSGVDGCVPLIRVWYALGAFVIGRRDSPVFVPCAGWAPLAAVLITRP